MKYLKRFLALPFVAILAIVSAIFLVIRNITNYIMYGAEFITYKKGMQLQYKIFIRF